MSASRERWKGYEKVCMLASCGKPFVTKAIKTRCCTRAHGRELKDYERANKLGTWAHPKRKRGPGRAKMDRE